MSRYEEIEAFVRTVQAGSLTGAAKQLRVAKSALTRRIQELEARLGGQLLIRTTRKLSLTEAGEALYRRSQILLEDWQEAEDEVGDKNAALSGTIRLAAPLSFGVRHLGPALLMFRELHPDINFEIDFSDRKVNLVEEGIDLAVRVGQLEDSSLVARKIAPVRMVVAASPNYISKLGVPKTPEDITEMNELRYTLRRERGWEFTATNSATTSIKLNSNCQASNGTFLTEAAIRGEGIVIQPSFLMDNALSDGRLIQLLPDYTLPELGLFAVYPPTRHLSKRLRVLIDYLVEHCSGPYWDEWDR